MDTEQHSLKRHVITTDRDIMHWLTETCGLDRDDEDGGVHGAVVELA